MATLKPTTPLLTPNTGPLKPTTPLRPKTAPKPLISHPQRRSRFQTHTGTSEQRRQGFHTTGPPGRQGLTAVPAGDDDTTASQISHAIRLEEVSTISENVAIPTLLIHDSKESRGELHAKLRIWHASRRRVLAEQRADAPATSATKAPPAWRAPAVTGGPGCGARRRRGQARQHTDTPDRLEAAARPAGPGRTTSRRAKRSSRRGRRAGGQAARRPEICRGNKPPTHAT